MNKLEFFTFSTLLMLITPIAFSGGGNPKPKPQPTPKPPVIESIEYNGDILISNRVVKGISGHVGLNAIGYGYEFHGQRGAMKDIMEFLNVGNTYMASETTINAFEKNGFVGYNGVLGGSSHSFADSTILAAKLDHHEQSNLIHFYVDHYQAMLPSKLYGITNPFPNDQDVMQMPGGPFDGNYVRFGKFRNDGYVKYLLTRMDYRHINDRSFRAAKSAYALQNASMTSTKIDRTFMTKKDTVGIRQ